MDGAPGWTPTNGLSLRRRSLYAPELREHMNCLALDSGKFSIPPD
jgi:hypothetical protein